MRLKTRQISALTLATLLIFGFQNCAKVGTNGINVESLASSANADVSPVDTAIPGTPGDGEVPVSSGGIEKMKQSFTVNSTQKIDILFVVDNSGSMEYEQQSMASRLNDFIQIVAGLDWRISVTTTDPKSSVYGDGNLVALHGSTNTFIMDSSMDQITAQNVLGQTIQRSETGSASEQGIYATRRAIERSIASTDVRKQFIRPDAALAVIVISDEDESAYNTKNSGKNLISYIDYQFSNRKAFTFNSIISRPGDTNCLNGEGKTEGYKYQELSKLTGGIIGDVCATDYSSQVKAIAKEINKTAKAITLSCAPVDLVNSPIVVTQNNQPVANFTVSGRNLVFADELAPGTYDVSFACAK
ncbi:hypothetical protein NWE73_14940 [Bdellovibrio sp. PAP01]|uniref:VWFA domain-containing protein n=2 Tax=Bdellovibrio svalbardensis TaxID=2972972 RepID=A0ABT6DLB9_9BACT|nr:hypothetical protein [Bdellovibrio svalbardensis]